MESSWIKFFCPRLSQYVSKKRRQEMNIYYTMQEIAEMTGKSYGYIAQQVRMGYLKAKGKRNKIIKKEWLDEWLDD